MRKIPFYLTQDGLDEILQLLYRHQALVNIASSDHPTCDRATRIMSEIRRQCCVRSGAADAFDDHPMTPADTLESGTTQRRRG